MFKAKKRRGLAPLKNNDKDLCKKIPCNFKDASKSTDKPKSFLTGFTLIEILITIIIIGILAAIILVMISSSKDNARKKSAYSEVRAVQAELLQCVINSGWTMSCTGTDLNCRGQITGSSNPVAGGQVCGVFGDPSNRSNIAWPEITIKYGYAYGQAACSRTSGGAFSYAIGKDSDKNGVIDATDKIFCCTQNGCNELAIQNYGPFSTGTCVGTTGLNSTLCRCKINGAGDYAGNIGGCQ